MQLDGAAQDETVVIENLGDEPVDLSGWSIQSYGGGACQPMAEQVYTFPAGLHLTARASLHVHSGAGALSAGPSSSPSRRRSIRHRPRSSRWTRAYRVTPSYLLLA